jgi:putative addiction module antidote
MGPIKLRKIGNSTGFVLPKEVTSKLGLEEGDSVYLVESADGFRLTPYDPEFEEQMAVARKIMKKRRNALRALAK